MQKIIRVDEEKKELLSEMRADCYVLSDTLSDGFNASFVNITQKQDKIVLFYGEKAVDLCKKYGADGVIVDLEAESIKNKMPELRKDLGKGKFVGAFTRNRRHESMLVSEAEPDFIVFKVWKEGFEQVKELVNWYNDFFLIQSGVWVMDDDVFVEELNADFAIIS